MGLRWLGQCACVALAIVAFSGPVVADTGLQRRAWEMVYELKRDSPAVQSIEFVMMPGTSEITPADQLLLESQLAKLNIASRPEAQDLLANYQRMLGEHQPFRADPLKIPVFNGHRYVCAVKLDFHTPYTRDDLLSYLRVEQGVLESAGIDVSRLPAERLLQHIAFHELWHCLDMTQEAYLRFAHRIAYENLGDESWFIFPELLRNHAEVGADLFATLMDMRNYGDDHMIDLVIAVREANLKKKKDTEHYTVPALKLLRQARPAYLKGMSIPQLIDQVNDLRLSGIDSQAFATMYRAINASPVPEAK